MSEDTTASLQKVLKQELEKGFEEQARFINTAFQEQKDNLEKKISNLVTKDEFEKKISNLVTKDYLDEKLSDLKGDLSVLMRKEDRKLGTLVAILKNRRVISEDDAQQILALEPFPRT